MEDRKIGSGEDECKQKLLDLVDRKIIGSRDIGFMEDKTIKDQEQQQPGSSLQLAIVIDLAFADSTLTQSADRHQSTVEYQSGGRQQLADEVESKSDEEPTNGVEPEPNHLGPTC